MKSSAFLQILTLLFIALKLTGFIHWSWWWILAPMWLPVTLAVLIVVPIVVYRLLRTE